jgi:EAL domain-containing protein (putative c-di-GMP-specific phosphodiesterase class I)
MKEIDNLVVRRAFHDMETKIRTALGISINLSNEQLIDQATDSSFRFRRPAFHRAGTGHPGDNGDQPGEKLRGSQESLQKLKERGFVIAIDDFGKGFSSLSYLTELPADILKIDMDFVRPIPGDRKRGDDGPLYHRSGEIPGTQGAGRGR